MTSQLITLAVALIALIVVFLLPLDAMTKLGCVIGISITVGIITKHR